MKEFILAMLIVLIGFVIVYVPLSLIWSLNVLFSLNIPYTFKTWCAMALLMTIVGGLRITYKS
jgi:H+/gluconate symporter-like permease